ncbi:MAG: tRNA (guanosine(46)-N7)-methyltransferase TrmB [Lautropia sp.]
MPTSAPPLDAHAPATAAAQPDAPAPTDARADTAAAAHRAPRSYVLRRSHFSPAQREAHARLMPRFGIPFQASPIDIDAIFGRRAPTVLEIGFGMGDTTARIAAARPDWNFIGVEVHTPGVGALLKQIDALHLTNLRLIEHDVQPVLAHMLVPGSLTGVHVFFPDPWPKARHHKRRLVNQQFLTKIFDVITEPGYLHCATDWPDYAAAIEAAMRASAFDRVHDRASASADAGSPFASMINQRPLTKFEKRGIGLGHPIVDLLAVRTAR